MPYQIGIKASINTSALTGDWRNEQGEHYDSEHTITKVSWSKGDVVEGICAKGIPFGYPSVVLLHAATKVTWNPLPKHVIDSWVQGLNAPKHEHSIERARCFMEEHLKIDPLRKSYTDQIIVTLDGNGENRRGMYTALETSGVARKDWPKILTFEVDADVALANQMFWGKENVRYCGADPKFSSKSMLGGKKYVLIEHLIQRQNSILTDNEKTQVVALYLDYCGGPTGNQDPDKCRENLTMNMFPHLPNLEVFAVTMSHRRHSALNPIKPTGRAGISAYVEVPEHFRSIRTFDENTRVICELFSTRPLLKFATHFPRPRGRAPNALDGASKIWNDKVGIWQESEAVDSSVRTTHGKRQRSFIHEVQGREEEEAEAGEAEEEESDGVSDSSEIHNDVILEAMQIIHGQELAASATHKRLRIDKLSELTVGIDDTNGLVQCVRAATDFADANMPADNTKILRSKLCTLQTLEQRMLELHASIALAQVEVVCEIDRLSEPIRN